METTHRLGDDLRSIQLYTPPPQVVTAVNLNTGQHGHHDTRHGRPKGWKRLAVFWSVSGGTILSALGFLGLTLYQQYSDNLAELQRDLKHFNETSADFVKKESLHNRLNFVRDGFKEARAASQSTAKEIATLGMANVARDGQLHTLENRVKTLEDERRSLTTELQNLRERLATIEGRQAAMPALLSPRPTTGPGRR